MKKLDKFIKLFTWGHWSPRRFRFLKRILNIVINDSFKVFESSEVHR
jgi:hypothetical protein